MRNFKKEEFACQCKKNGYVGNEFCGGQVWINDELVEGLQVLRNIIKKPIIINSGCRCEEYNKIIGGAKNSMHVKGKAVDIRVPSLSAKELYNIIEHHDLFTGRGLYNTFVHVDVRNGTAGKIIEWRG